MATYRVTAACLVHVPVRTMSGPALGTLYKGAVLPDNVPPEKIKSWLRSKMIEEVGGASAAADSGTGAGKAGPAEKSTVESKEADRQPDGGAAGTPTDGPAQGASDAPPLPPEHGAGSSKDAWVDYAVAHRGMDRAVADGMAKADLIKTLRGEGA